MYAEHRYWTLLYLIEQLPAHTRFNQAVLNDPEQIQVILDRTSSVDEADAGEKPPSVESWSPVMEMMARLIDGQEKLITLTSRVNDGDYEPQPALRPRLAFEDELKRRKEAAREKGVQDIISRMTPGLEL